MNTIEIANLSKTYRSHIGVKSRPVLDNLSLNVKENEIYGFLGKNGAGKTSTIKILCGLIRPSSGSAKILGESVRKRTARQHIGYLPENPYFYEYLTPKETISFYAKLEGMTRAERSRRWDELSEILDLRGIADQRVRGFSKGMRQRLGFAVTLVSDPKVLILDEPMSGLDPMGRHMIREIILHLKEQKKTIFFSSHILADVEQICDRIGMLIDGRLQAEGNISDLLSRKVNQVELIARAIPDSLVEEIRVMADTSRESEDGVHFQLPNLDAANQAARRIQQEDGVLVEITPIKESLEDYFVREQMEKGVEA
ncbi:MAG: ABC transporter [Candidatus Hydrogenedentota bacterium]|nr:MAG: ABC transporter [Candidatus Hydrogenedentota bacterium]